jgi:branched-chain amino acid transport system ATP-binding protein
MTVEENLRLGGARLEAARCHERRQAVEALFPVLAARRRQLAGTLSGGERKMLGLGRGLMADPRLLVVDEPSLGLAPLAAGALFEALGALNRGGLTILLVEQNVHTTLEVAGRGYVLEQGRVALAGTTAELLANPHVQASYLGVTVSEE